MPISVLGEASSFYDFDMKKTVANMLESNKHMSKMTFVPVIDCHRDAFNSRLFHESKLFGMQSICTNVGKVTALDIVKINIDRRPRLVRVESIAFDRSIQDLVLRCRILFRGLEMRNHQQFHSQTPVREQIFISDALESIKVDTVVRKMGQIQQFSGYYLHNHSATAFEEPSSRYIKDISTLPAHCSERQPARELPTGTIKILH